MYGVKGARELDAYARDLDRSEHRTSEQQLLERAARHQLHPQADVAANLIGAMNGDDVWAPHACQQPALGDYR